MILVKSFKRDDLFTRSDASLIGVVRITLNGIRLPDIEISIAEFESIWTIQAAYQDFALMGIPAGKCVNLSAFRAGRRVAAVGQENVAVVALQQVSRNGESGGPFVHAEAARAIESRIRGSGNNVGKIPGPHGRKRPR